MPGCPPRSRKGGKKDEQKVKIRIPRDKLAFFTNTTEEPSQPFTANDVIEFGKKHLLLSYNLIAQEILQNKKDIS